MEKTAVALKKEFQALGDPAYAAHHQRFFKTGPGEYGEGDRFHGIRVPVIRDRVKQYRGIGDKDVAALLRSPYHEERLFSLIMMVDMYRSGNPKKKNEIYRMYLVNTAHINNWDLVDTSAGNIVGAHLFRRDKTPLYRLAGSESLWERRISIIATSYMIRRNSFSDTLAISKLLLHDSANLIHKAVGWMLREVGKRDGAAMEEFIRSHFHEMPRTMLRYAIEKLPEKKRKAYLRGDIKSIV